MATQIILKTTESTTGKWFIADSWLVKQTTFTEHLEWYLYNKFERTDFDDYSILTDADKMREIADANESMKEAEKKAYEGLNLFVRSYALYGMTMAMGDIPCSEAVKGESDAIYSPKYDTQEAVFESILNDLRKASDLFSEASSFNGDPVYNGDPSLWQKAANSFSLRVLNMLSKKKTLEVSMSAQCLRRWLYDHCLLQKQKVTNVFILLIRVLNGIHFIGKTELLDISVYDFIHCGYDEETGG